MMKALIRDRYGPPEVLEARDIERPAPKELEVSVQVRAASINDWDWRMLQRPMLPLGFNRPRVRILGSDIAGRIAAVGSGVQRFRKDFLLGLSCFSLLVVLIHSVIPFLKFCVGQKVHVGFCHHAASLVHRVNNGWIYSRIASSLQ